MARNTSVSLGDHLRRLRRPAGGGRALRLGQRRGAGLRLLEAHATRLEALRAALIEGENSGAALAVDFSNFAPAHRGGSAW